MTRQDLFGEFATNGRLSRLVDQSGQALRVPSVGARLMAARQRARGFNWIEGGVMAVPPVVTVGAIGMALPGGMTAMADGRFGTARASYRVRGTGGPAFEENYVASNYYRYRSERTDLLGGFALGASSWELTIATDSRYVAFELLGSAARAYSVYVRDLVGTNSGLTAAAGHNIGAANQTLLLDFGAAGDREVTLLLGSGEHGVRGIAIEAAASMYGTAPDDLRCLVKSDSYGFGTVSPQPAYVGRTLTDCMRAMLGCDLVQQGIGGSGYIEGNNLQNVYRQEDAAAVGADLNLIMLGTNDVGAFKVGATLQTAAERCLNGLRDRGMETPIIVGGPWPQNRMSAGVTALKTNTLQAEQDLASVVAKLNDPGIVFLPLNTAGMATPWGGTCTPWVTGTQDTDTAGGDAGNSLRVMGNDGFHPSLYGAVFLARRLVNEVTRTCLHQGW